MSKTTDDVANEAAEMNFDVAHAAAADRLNPDAVQDTQTSVQDVQQVEGEVDPKMEEAVKTAEIAAQTASDKDKELQAAQEQINQLTSENEAIKATLIQANAVQREAIVNEALVMPALDVISLAFDDEETILSKQNQYAQDMAAYTEKKKAQLDNQKSEVISTLSTIPELSDIADMMPQLNKIIANNKALSAMDETKVSDPQEAQEMLQEKLITAYAIAKGVNALNAPPPAEPEAPKEMTPQEMIELYKSNPEFQDMVNKHRLEQAKDGQQVPVFSASSGAVNAALNIKDKPTTFDEADKRTRERFGLR